MSRENVELALRSVDAWNSRDADTELVHDDIEVRPAITGWLEGGVYRGREAWPRYLEDVDDAWSEFSYTVEDTRDLGTAVLLLGRFQAIGRESGATVDLPSGVLVTIRDGRIYKIEGFRTRDEALEAVGLRK